MRGTGGGAGELIGAHRFHRYTRAFGDGACEVVPTAFFVVGVVSDPPRIELRKSDDGAGEMRRVRRPAALIVDNAQRIGALADLIANRLDEIRTVHAEEPRRADNEVFLRVRRRDLA